MGLWDDGADGGGFKFGFALGGEEVISSSSGGGAVTAAATVPEAPGVEVYPPAVVSGLVQVRYPEVLGLQLRKNNRCDFQCTRAPAIMVAGSTLAVCASRATGPQLDLVCTSVFGKPMSVARYHPLRLRYW